MRIKYAESIHVLRKKNNIFYTATYISTPKKKTNNRNLFKKNDIQELFWLEMITYLTYYASYVVTN